MKGGTPEGAAAGTMAAEFERLMESDIFAIELGYNLVALADRALYQVKAHGDVLEMHLAKGHGGDKAPEAHAKKHGKKKH